MDVSKLKYNRSVLKAFAVQSNNVILASRDCKIMFPKHYLDGSLGNTDDYFNVVGIFALIVGDEYAVSLVDAIMPLSPENTTVLTVDNVQYIVLEFETGAVICPDNRLVMNDQLLSHIYTEFYDRGRFPWYLSLSIASRIFETDYEHTGASLNTDKAILEMIVSMCARHPERKLEQIRYSYQKQSDLNTIDFSTVGFGSIGLGATNTISSIGGSWYDTGLTTVLVKPPKKLEPVEELFIS